MDEIDIVQGNDGQLNIALQLGVRVDIGAPSTSFEMHVIHRTNTIAEK